VREKSLAFTLTHSVHVHTVHVDPSSVWFVFLQMPSKPPPKGGLAGFFVTTKETPEERDTRIAAEDEARKQETLRNKQEREQKRAQEAHADLKDPAEAEEGGDDQKGEDFVVEMGAGLTKADWYKRWGESYVEHGMPGWVELTPNGAICKICTKHKDAPGVVTGKGAWVKVPCLNKEMKAVGKHVGDPNEKDPKKMSQHQKALAADMTPAANKSFAGGKHKDTQDHRKRLLTLYHMVKRNIPLDEFKGLLELQMSNGAFNKRTRTHTHTHTHVHTHTHTHTHTNTHTHTHTQT
jgi:hypothetical protein